MSETGLTIEERLLLLKLARQALEAGVKNEPIDPVDLNLFSERLREEGASFVTLTKTGNLRGCIGTLEAYRPLVEDVRKHAVAAATEDYRFPRVEPGELSEISIEISRLTKPVRLAYKDAEDLLERIRPNVDGVVLRDGLQRATFLPQVWQKVPETGDFLDHLCLKMGIPADSWRTRKLEVFVYQVEEFHE